VSGEGFSPEAARYVRDVKKEARMVKDP